MKSPRWYRWRVNFRESGRVRSIVVESTTHATAVQAARVDHPRGSDFTAVKESTRPSRDPSRAGRGRESDAPSNLPQDLSRLSRSQTGEVISYLESLPLKELRKRQDLVRVQALRANEATLRNLRIMDQHLHAAIDKKEFGGRG
jgi:hypothetical protein